jgi:hypothetical protein
MTTLQKCTNRSTRRKYAESWQDRFDPDSYGPVVPWKQKCKERSPINDPIEAGDLDPFPVVEDIEPLSQERHAETRLIRGLAIGLDKTDLDEEETREFLQFVAKARKKKGSRRRVRLLPSSENSR